MEVHAFPKDISMKMNVITRLGIKLTHYDITVQHISH